MLRIGLAFFLVGVALANELSPTGVIDGHFPGRSGDVVVHLPQQIEDGSLSFWKNTEVANFHSIESSRVGDLLSHMMGTAPLNPEDSREDFPAGSIFEKPNANLLVVVDGVLPSGVTFGKTQFPIVDDSYPRDNLQLLTTALASAEPSVHGISRHAWFDKENDKHVLAYDDWCPSRSGPTVANLFDIATHSFEGQSLIISGSASSQLARALSAKAYLLEESSNNYGLVWNEEKFQSVYSDRSALLDLTKDKIMGSVQGGVLHNLANFQAVRAEDAMYLELSLADGRVARFDLQNPNDFGLIAEVVMMMEVVDEIASGNHRSLVNDNAPDFFAFGFSTVQTFWNEHGGDSAKYLGAIHLIRSAFEHSATVLSDQYGGQLLAEALFLGSSMQGKWRDVEQTVLSAVGDSLATQPDQFETYFPELYLKDGVNSASICEQLNALIANFDSHARAYCSTDLEELSTERRVGRGVSGFVDYMEKASSDDSSDVFIFQCVIWFNAILVVALVMAVYPIMGIESHMPQIVFRDTSAAHKKTG